MTSVQTKPLDLDIIQPDYEIRDWANAIGSCKIQWKLSSVRVDKTGILAHVSGRNRYRWHPEVPRKSQRVHIAAERLKEFGAKEFDMVFKPCIISVATGDVFRES